jgi:hypothetical protein
MRAYRLCPISTTQYGRVLHNSSSRLVMRQIMLILRMFGRLINFRVWTRDNNNITLNITQVLFLQLHSPMQARQVSNFAPLLRSNRFHLTTLLIGQEDVGYNRIIIIASFICSLLQHVHLHYYFFATLFLFSHLFSVHRFSEFFAQFSHNSSIHPSYSLNLFGQKIFTGMGSCIIICCCIQKFLLLNTSCVHSLFYVFR